jgi:hypothetical protein
MEVVSVHNKETDAAKHLLEDLNYVNLEFATGLTDAFGTNIYVLINT